MTGHAFTLLPFPGPGISDITVTGEIGREQNLLKVRYSVKGNTGQIFFPAPTSYPGRKDGLWRATCFEFFLAICDLPQYWEFNLSSSGEWNAFRMDAYRSVGFQQEEGIQDVQMEISRDKGRFHLAAFVDLSAIIDPTEKIQAGITCIIQTLDGHETYWALAHPAAQADFHLRESFILSL